MIFSTAVEQFFFISTFGETVTEQQAKQSPGYDYIPSIIKKHTYYDDHNKEMLNLITVDDKEKRSVKPVVLMRVSYKFAFDNGKKINDNTIIYPAKVKDKLAFIKIAVQ